MRIWQRLKGELQEFESLPALTCGDMTLSYRNLLAEVEAQALKLVKLGQRIAIACDNRRNELIAILACLASDKTSIILNAKLGNPYIHNICMDAHADCLLVDAVNEKDYFDMKCISFNGKSDDDIAVLLYSSGTSGKPKGVCLSDKNICFGVDAVLEYFKPNACEKFLVSRPFSNVAALMGDLLAPLFRGMQLYISDEIFSPSRLLSFMRDNKIGYINGTPTSIFHIVDRISNYDLKCLKNMVLSGERLTGGRAEFLVDKIPGCAIFNAYGLTEASGRVSVLYPNDLIRKKGSVGKPVEGVEIKINDGIIFVKSAGVTEKYFSNKSLTKERIFEGWLNTGDRGYFDEEGYLFIDGRADEMIIRAGVNIYPQEIENVLNNDKRIHDSLVYSEYDDLYGQRICAKIVRKDDGVDKQYINKLCMKELPAYMRLSRVEFIDNLPKTLGGKKIRNRI